MRADYDVIIVGAGPGGSTCAWFAAKAGLRVLLLDAERFPRDKACGDALSRTKAVPILQEMGLGEALDREATHQCGGVTIASCRNDVFTVPIPQSGDPLRRTHRIVPRRIFDRWLLDQVRPHVDVMEGFRVTGLLRDGQAIRGVMGQQRGGGPQRFSGAAVVGADGIYSAVAKHAGLRAGLGPPVGLAVRGYLRDVAGLNGHIEFFFIEELLPGSLWVFPCGPGVANVGIAIWQHQLASMGLDLNELLWRTIRRHPLLCDRFQRAQLVAPLRGWPLMPWAGRRRITAPGVGLIGDAAQLVDPITGEGIGNAMLSGKLAAEALAESWRERSNVSLGLRVYERRLWASIGPEFRLSRFLLRITHFRPVVDAGIRWANSSRWMTSCARRLIQAPNGKRQLSALIGRVPDAIAPWRRGEAG